MKLRFFASLVILAGCLVYPLNAVSSVKAEHIGLEQQIKAGIKNPDLYNQYGIFYYKQGNTGQAVLYFLRALRIDSNHREARNNLDYALSQSMDREMYTPPSFLASIFQQVFNFFSLNALAVILLLLLILTVLCIHWLLHLKAGEDRAVPMMWLVIIGFIFVLFLTLTALKFHSYRNASQAVVITPEAEGFSGPGPEFGKLFTLHSGLILHINRVDKDWALVTLPNGGAGWIPVGSVERVKP